MGLEDWNVCHRSGVALSALLCAVCKGGVECKLHENKRGERERVAGGSVGWRETLKQREKGCKGLGRSELGKYFRGTGGRQRTTVN